MAAANNVPNNIGWPYVVRGNRIAGSVILIHNQYRFRRNRISALGIHWRCSKCKATVRTNHLDLAGDLTGLNVVVEKEGARPHDHPPLVDLIAKEAFRRRCLGKLNFQEPFFNIFHYLLDHLSVK